MKHSKTHTTEDTWQLGKLILHCAMFARYDHGEKNIGKNNVTSQRTFVWKIQEAHWH